MDDQQIHCLLQLKSYEAPSSEMVEQFIFEFHRRHEAMASASFLEELRERIAFFLSEFQVPKMAYVGATAFALFCSFFILQVNKPAVDATSSPLSSENFSAIHYYSSPINQNDAEPVSFDIPKEGNDSLFSPMSHFLKKKSAPQKSLMSF